MQSYKESQQYQTIGKTILSDFLGFLKYKVDNDLLTLDEAKALASIIKQGVELYGTSEDFARYYNQNPVNVRSVICRKLLARPSRRVLYPFSAFSSVIPDKWRK